MPTALYSQLQQVALTGTRRLPLSKLTSYLAPAQNPIDHALHAALTQADTPDALRLLRAVAIATVTERATWQGTPMAPEMDESTLAPAPTPPPFSTDIVQAMRELMTATKNNSYCYFATDCRLLFISLLCSLEEAQQSLPPELVVHALAMGSYRLGHSTDEALRAYLAPVLGARGYWLARQNPAWQWAAWLPNDADDEIVWQQGNVEQRKALLLRERETNPDAARERLAAGFEQMNSQERIVLIQTLTTNLSMKDEPFLEGLLQRTGRVVGRILRGKIVNLLDKLPQSRHSQRIIVIMQGLLQQDKKGTWHIEPPEDFDPAWERDGISPDNYTPHSGRRAACLCTLVEHTPLSFWIQTTGMCAKELVNLAKKTTWRKALLEGWAQVLETTHSDVQWVAAYASINYSITDLIPKLPQDQREAIWLERLPDFETIGRCQNWCGASLSAPFSQHLIAHIQRLAKRAKLRSLITKETKVIGEGLYPLYYVIMYLDYSVLPEATTLLQTYEELWSSHFPEVYTTACEILALRHKLYACQAAIASRVPAAL